MNSSTQDKFARLSARMKVIVGSTDYPSDTLKGKLKVAGEHLKALARPADNTPAPNLPDLQNAMRQAKLRAARVGRLTAGIQTWRELVTLYRDAQEGHPITGRKVWTAFQSVSKAGSMAASATWKRHLTVITLDAAASLIAHKTADKAAESAIARALHLVSKRLAGRAAIALTAFDTFRMMQRDIKRFNGGELSRDDFYRNCALTGVGVAAPLAGSALAGPAGATAGMAISISAGMLRR